MERSEKNRMQVLCGCGETTRRLLEAASGIWADYPEHPFVKGMTDGTLDHEAFQYYMLQDYVYLYDYARVFSLGAAKAEGEQSMRCFSRAVSLILDGEMDIHRAYMKRLGISEERAEQTKPALDNLAYSSYMIRIAYEGGAAETAAAILSCALSYEWIAHEMERRNPGASEHPFFGEWVRGYTGASYCEGNRALIALTEELTKGYTEQQLEALEEIFVNCSQFEARFWDMAWEQRT